MSNTRKLNLGAVSLVKGRVRNDIETMTIVRDELEAVLNNSGWFPSAPFTSVGLIIRYTTKTNLTPDFQGIDKSKGELRVAVELNMEQLRVVHREPGKLKSIVRDAISRALCGVADKYELSKQTLDEYISCHNDA